MQRHWTKLGELKIDRFDVVIDKSWEDIHPGDLFDTSLDPDTGLPYFDIDDICRKIDRCDLDWFILRARAFYKGIELASHYVGGFLYEDAMEVFADGTAQDLAEEAAHEAGKTIETLVLGYISDGSGREPKIIKQETVCL
jgi:hypothetical protein